MVEMNDAGVVGVLLNKLDYVLFVMGTSFQQMTCLSGLLNAQENLILLINYSPSLPLYIHYTT